MIKLSSILCEEIEKRKYPRTFHLPWSEGQSDDDKTHTIETVEKMFGNKEIVVTEKMDGENFSAYSDGTCHARSLDSGPHPSRSYVKAKLKEIGCLLPLGWRIMGENLYATHSIEYKELPDYFILFNIADQNNMALSWNEIEEWGELLEVPVVKVLWRGVWNAEDIKKLYPFKSFYGAKIPEGYVVRDAGRFPMDDFTNHVAKFVRKHHVQTDQHWMQKTVVPNIIKKPV